MSLFDWVEMGFGDHNRELSWFKGSLNITIGDVLQGKFGASHEHVFGPKITLVCDPEDMLLNKLDKFMPLTSGLLAGVGGRVDFNYGTVFKGDYVGPKVDVRRAPNRSKTSDNVLHHVKDDTGAETDEIDKATSIAAAALSVLVVGTAAALELALHFAYPKFGSTSPGDKETIEGYGKAPELLRVCSYTITTRLMALLKVLEEKSTFADFGQQFLLEARFLLLSTTTLVAFMLPPVMIIPILMAKADEDVFSAIDNAKNALAAAAD